MDQRAVEFMPISRPLLISVIHVLIIVKLACRVDFDVNGTFGTFIDLLANFSMLLDR